MISDQVRQHLDFLTKPRGSLGRLEDLLIRYAEIRGLEPPATPRVAAFICCADHGVTAEGVSAWPSEITRLMVQNFVAGGAAISVLCRNFGIDPRIIDMGVQGAPVPGAENCRVAEGTKNFVVEPAMTLGQARQALDIGRRLARDAAESGYDMLLAGEMGIGNTTPATALLCAYTGAEPLAVTGPGAGLSADRISAKADVVRRALALHSSRVPMEVAANLGGFEILAIAGLILGSAELRLPLMLDGFITCSAALVVQALEPSALDCVIYSHRSAEPGHRAMLDQLGARPILDLEMRLGEGSAAALAVSIFQSACCLYHQMATLDQLTERKVG